MTMLNAFKAVSQALAALKLTEGVLAVTETEERKERLEAPEAEESRTIVDEIEVEARELVSRVRALLKEGNLRKLRIKDQKGKYLLEVPLSVGVLAGGIFALSAPTLAALGTIAGFLVKVKIEIVRDTPEGTDSTQ